MEQQPIIEIKNVGKRYAINHAEGQMGGYVSLRDVIANFFGSPLKFIKKKAKDFKTKKEAFWALSDVSFSVKKGEVVGIIGRNGSGKSTLLKILSQITPPTTGEIKIMGRVGSLLEVGTGFHPELTGRENMFLNGAILGMGKKEISEKFDKIVEFSGIGQFIDTPVKYYSSGMYVRLAFAVASHMEPDILLLDEVLAVGDLEFQKKCLDRMEQVTKNEGRTILFVSHNMEAVRQLCSTVVLLEKGKVVKVGPTNKIVNEYINRMFSTDGKEVILPVKPHSPMSFTKISMENSEEKTTNKINHREDFFINLELETYSDVKNADIFITIKNSRHTDILLSCLSDSHESLPKTFTPGKYNFKVKFDGGYLMPDDYFIKIYIAHPELSIIDTREDVFGFTIQSPKETEAVRSINYGIGCVSFPNKWYLK